MSSRQSHSDDRWRAFASPFLRHVPIDAGESSALRRARAGHQAAGAGEPLASGDGCHPGGGVRAGRTANKKRRRDKRVISLELVSAVARVRAGARLPPCVGLLIRHT
jgi:hypothetical protein